MGLCMLVILATFALRACLRALLLLISVQQVPFVLAVILFLSLVHLAISKFSLVHHLAINVSRDFSAQDSQQVWSRSLGFPLP